MLVTNKRKVLSIEEKVKLIQEIEYGKNRTKSTSVFEQNGLRMKCFKRLNEMMSLRWCVSGLIPQRSESAPVSNVLLLIICVVTKF